MKHLYPLFLNIEGKRCLVVGAGKVACRKIESLLEYGAEIIVVSPRAEDKIIDWQARNLIKFIPREFEAADLDNIFMVFIATDDKSMNQTIAGLCKQKGILVNAVDDPENCDFFVPALLRRHSLTVAISTEGKSPAFAAWLKRQLEREIGEEFGELVEMLGEIRPLLKNSPLSYSEKRNRLITLINSDWMAKLKGGQKHQLKERIIQWISSWQD